MPCAARRGRKVQGQCDRTNQNLFQQSGWSSTPPRCLTTSPPLPRDVRAPAGKHSQVTSVCMTFSLPVFRMRESYLCSQCRTFNGCVWKHWRKLLCSNWRFSVLLRRFYTQKIKDLTGFFLFRIKHLGDGFAAFQLRRYFALTSDWMMLILKQWWELTMMTGSYQQSNFYYNTRLPIVFCHN